MSTNLAKLSDRSAPAVSPSTSPASTIQPIDASGVGEVRSRAPVRLPLLQTYLDEQQRLSAVERFSQHHDRSDHDAQARYYEDLIPSRRPELGEQYAFQVDLDRCTGCKACVTACRSLNGLDEGETWRAVGVLHGGTAQAPFQQTVTTACHHCVDPGCLKGCPVVAYEKDPVTGIVRHLDDQCIGCQYCTLTCPYEVPQYSDRLGIVRKCDMCSGRLEAGEAPACVQACPNEAISIRVVKTEAAVARASGALVPEAPASRLTVPTTEYTTARALPANLVPADLDDLRPATPHTPLAVMLVLSQASAGAFLFGAALGRPPALAALALLLGLIGLVSSPLHLGRPQYGFRAILGARTSWLSREILAFGGFAPVAIAYVASLLYAPAAARFGLPQVPEALLDTAQRALSAATLVAAAGVVCCSVMVYAVTGRAYWSLPRTATRFGASALAQGSVMALVVAAVTGGPVAPLAGLAALANAGKLAFEASILRALRPQAPPDLRRTARLLTGPLATSARLRLAAGAVGGVALPILTAIGAALSAGAPALAGLSLLSWLLVLAGELLERALFFTAVSAPRMPGGITR